MIRVEDSLHFVYEKIINNENAIMYQQIDFKEIEKYRIGHPNNNEIFLAIGSQPAFIADDNKGLHIAFTKGEDKESEIYYLYLGEVWTTSRIGNRVTNDSSYSYSPSLAIKDGKIFMLYHSNSAIPEKFIDHYYFASTTIGQSEWSLPQRLPSLTTNGKYIYLSLNFKLPWARRVYNKHNVKIFFNGWLIGNLQKIIPQGNMMFPINPRILNYHKNTSSINRVTIKTKHFNPAHYLATSTVRLISDLTFMEEYVFANSQQEADELLASRKEYNHIYPDLGIYVDGKTKVPSAPKDGEDIKLSIKIWNIGQAATSKARVEIFGGKNSVSKPFSDKFLLFQKKIKPLKPGESLDLSLPFTYWSGLERIHMRVISKEEDFNFENNTHKITFISSTGNHFTDSLMSYGNKRGVLRVAVWDEPGIVADDIEVKIYAQNPSSWSDTTSRNPKIWLLEPNVYDVNIKSKTVPDVEQWIRGVPINRGYSTGRYGYYYQNSISLDISLQKLNSTLDSLGAVKTAADIRFTMPTEILFHSNKYEINIFAEDYLKRIRTIIKSYPKSILRIEGHTDSIGSVYDNQILSEKRAESVKQWLLENEDFDVSRLNSVGFGETDPLVSNSTENGRAKNRRVNFILELNN